jgi:hypothetical protein
MPAPETSNPIAAMQAKAPSRLVYRYTFSAEHQALAGDGVTSIGLVKLTVGEERMAYKLAHGDDFDNAIETLKMSLREVNGQPVNVADGTAETALNKMDQITRGMVVVARSKLQQPAAKDLDDFLGSVKAAL